MNRRFSISARFSFLGLAFAFYLTFFSSLLFAEKTLQTATSVANPDRIGTIRSLYRCQKLTDPQAVLEDFVGGKSTSRVIVNIRKPEFPKGLQDFSDVKVQKHLKETVSQTQNHIINSLDPFKVDVINRFTYIFAFSAQVTLQGLQELINTPEVDSIEKDDLQPINLAQGISMINALTIRSSYNGAGVAIAVCDTGIDYTHPKLGGGGFPNTKVIGGYDCGNDDPDPMDRQGHGTACAGIAAGNPGNDGDYIGGVAYGAKLYALKVTFGDGDSAYVSDQIESWEWCITHQNDDPANPIMIISMSVGSGRYYSACDSASPSRAETAANVVAAGIALFFSSGNDGYCDSIVMPACISHAISVGAVYDADLGRHPPQGYVGCIKDGSCVGTSGPPCDEKWYADDPANADQVCTYSNTASFLDLLAPSNSATTTELGGGYSEPGTGFGGTSAACPYAAGAAACLQCAAKEITGAYLTPNQVKSKIIETGHLVTDAKVSITKARVNLERAVDSLLNGDSKLYVDPYGVCGGNTPCYTTVQAAVDAASTGSIIKITEGRYNENVALCTSKQVTLSAGWNASYTTQTSNSTIYSLTRTAGTVIVKKLIMQR